MKNDYSWVAEKKQEAMRQKLQQRGMPRYAQRPVSERFGVSYTGLGSDGQLDRTAPAGFDTFPAPHVYHEGETRIATPEGRVYLSADVTQGAGLSGAAAVGQSPSGQMPGFASGGGMAMPAVAPRNTGNPYTANVIPGAQQPAPNAPQYQPRVQGWNVNPAAMGNYGAALLEQQPQTQPIPTPQQQPAPLPQQPTPVQGFESGGATPIVIGENGQGQTPSVSGENSVNSGAGSTPIANTSGTAGAPGSGSGTSVAGGAQDTLNKNNNSPFNAITSGIQQGADWLFGGGLKNAYRNIPQTLNNVAGKPAAETAANAPTTSRAKRSWFSPFGSGQITPEDESAEKERLEREEQARIAAANTPPEGLSTEKPVQPTYSNEPTSVSFQRGAEGQWRLNDMQREAAAQQSYQDFQQAMRGTDANAAWAQDQMLRAQQEEGINNFAAQYAQGADERNWNRINDMMGKILADPNSSAADLANAAQMANQLYPGADIDFSGRITEANARQFDTGMRDVLEAVAAGQNWEEAYETFKAKGTAANMGLSDAELWSLFNARNVNINDLILRETINSDEFKRLPPETQKAYRDYISTGLLFGDLIIDKEGKVVSKSEVEAEEAKVAEEVEENKFVRSQSDPYDDKYAALFEGTTDSNGKFTPNDPKGFKDITYTIAQNATTLEELNKLKTLPTAVRNAVLSHLDDMVKTRNGKGTHYKGNWSGKIAYYGNLDWSYLNKGVVYIDNSPAVVTQRDEKGQGLGDGNHRYEYTYVFLDTGATRTISA
jgi:hypothetical protein